MTVLQELIQKLESFKKELKEKYDGDPLVTRGINIAINEANDLLIKESYQIINAWDSAYFGDNNHSGEQYYNETYKQ